MLPMTNRPCTLVLGLALLIAVGCSGGSDAAKCVPGLTIECPCPTGQHGAQTCTPAGTFAACVCATPTVDDGGPGGSSSDDAILCTSSYLLGCVGDGRPDAPATPASLPTARCAKEAYSYFKMDITTSSPRSDIERCLLEISDASDHLVEEYTLPGGTDQSSGRTFGCSPDQTPSSLGLLSYSSCCASRGPLTFKLVALSVDGTIVQEGTGSGACSPYPPEVPVSIRTAPRN